MGYIEKVNVGGTEYDIVDSANIAMVEDGDTASKAYANGEYVVWHGRLYKATTAIALGTEFAIGTNVKATSVGDELSGLNSKYLPEIVYLTQEADAPSGFFSVIGTPPSGYAFARILSVYPRTSADITQQGILSNSHSARFYNAGNAISNTTFCFSWICWR